MAIGGTYLTHNKVLPGAYINFVSKARSMGTLGDRGIVALAFKLNWGPKEQVISITSEDFQKNSKNILGYDYSHEKMLYLREIFKNAREVKLFRLGGGNKATVTLNGLTITAKYEGSRGNDIKIKVTNNLDDESSVIIETYLDNTLVAQNSGSTISELGENDYVDFSGEITTLQDLENTAGTNLQGGTDTNSTNADYSKFLELLETQSFTTLLYEGDDEATKGLFTSFTKRLRDEEGVKITTILHNYSKADFEGVISLKNDPSLIYWLAGANASANVNESLTNKKYDGELDLQPTFNNSQMKEAIQNGDILLYFDSGYLKVLKDINSFTSFTSDKNSDFSSNQVIRVLDSVANDIANIFNTFYLGKVQNNSLGRNLFKSEVIDYINSLQAINAVEGFSSDDISIEKGVEKGDVIVNLSITPISAMEKLYMQCVIQ